MSRLIPVVVAAIAGLLVTGCGHSVSLKVTRKDKEPVFHFQMRGINGLLGLRLWRIDTKEVLWDVSLNYYRGSRLSYGEIPTEIRNTVRARQIYPKRSQKPQPLPPSTTFMVAITAQYDVPFAPSFQVFYFLFSTDASGALSRVTIPQRITADDLPKPVQ